MSGVSFIRYVAFYNHAWLLRKSVYMGYERLVEYLRFFLTWHRARLHQHKLMPIRATIVEPYPDSIRRCLEIV